MGRVRVTIAAVDKTMSVTNDECVFIALVIQHAMRMRHTVICGRSGCTTFFYISNKRYKKKIKHKMRVLICSANMTETFLILRRNERHIIINVHRTSCKVPVILVRF